MIKSIKSTSQRYFKKERQLRDFARNQFQRKSSRRTKQSLRKADNMPVRSSAFSNYKIYDLVY